MAATTILPAVNHGLRNVFSELGLLADAVEYREINGNAYIRLVPLGGKDRKAPPPPVFRLHTRVVPEMRRRVKRSVEVIRSDRFGAYLERWTIE